MKRLLLVLLVTAAAPAHAEEPSTSPGALGGPGAPAPRQRLVGVMLSTSQVLLWDEELGEYQLRRVGDELGGGRIAALEEDVVVIVRGDGEVREEIGITAPPQRRVAARRARRLPAMLVQVGPGADAAPGPAAPPATIAPPPPAPAAPPAPGAAAPAPSPVLAVSRARLEQELSSLGGPQQPVLLSANPEGGFRIVALRAGSLAESLGLRAGDVVLRIDGRPINNVGDAASAYAWLRLTDRFTIDLWREGRLVTLRCAFLA